MNSPYEPAMSGSLLLYTHTMCEHADRGNNIPEKKKKQARNEKVSLQAPLQTKGGQEVAQPRADVDKPKERVMYYSQKYDRNAHTFLPGGSNPLQRRTKSLGLAGIQGSYEG